MITYYLRDSYGDRYLFDVIDPNVPRIGDTVNFEGNRYDVVEVEYIYTTTEKLIKIYLKKKKEK